MLLLWGGWPTFEKWERLPTEEITNSDSDTVARYRYSNAYRRNYILRHLIGCKQMNDRVVRQLPSKPYQYFYSVNIHRPTTKRFWVAAFPSLFHNFMSLFLVHIRSLRNPEIGAAQRVFTEDNVEQ